MVNLKKQGQEVIKISAIFLFILTTNFCYGQDENKFLVINSKGHRGFVSDMVIDKAGYIITAGYDKTIKIWNSKDGFLEREILGEIETGRNGQIYALALSPDEKYLAVSGWFGNDDVKSGITDIRLYDYTTGKLIRLLSGHPDIAIQMEFFPKSDILLTSDYGGNVFLFDVRKKSQAQISNIPPDIVDMEMNGDFVVTTHLSGKVYLWNFGIQDKPIATYSRLTKPGMQSGCIGISPSGQRIAIANKNYIRILDENLKETFAFRCGEDSITKISFSPDNNRMLVVSMGQSIDEVLVKVYEFSAGELFEIAIFDKHTNAVICGGFLDNSTCVTAGGNDNEVVVWQIKKNKITPVILHWLSGVGFFPQSVGMKQDKIAYSVTPTSNYGMSDFEHVFDLTSRSFRKYELTDSCAGPVSKYGEYTASVSETRTTLSIKKNGSTLAKIENNSQNGRIHTVKTLIFDKFLMTGGFSGFLLAYDMAGNKVSSLIGHDDQIYGLGVSDDGKYLVSCSRDQTIRLWLISQIGKNKLVYPFVSIFITRNNEWVIWNEQGYFTSSKKGASYIGYHINHGKDKEAKYYPFEQFDIKFNRPDIIMNDLGFAEAGIIKLYHSAYLKRLKRMGLNETDLSGEMNAPVLQLKAMPVSEGKINISISGSDSLFALKALNVFLNGVPIYGRNGLQFESKNLNSFDQSIELGLMSGVNEIQVSVINVAGVESLKERVVVNNTEANETNLFIVSLGVSTYQNQNYNLDYAAKDAEDVNALFATNTHFKNVNQKVLLNKDVTRENIISLKEFLSQANRNDVVIFFIAGHGVLNKNLDYYFCTYNMDFLAPEKFGITYSELEVLFDGIKAIRKLLIMDTCHSGEVDKDDVEEIAFVNSENSDISFRNTNTTTTIRETQGLQKTNEAVKEMFNDLRRGTGATVISSAGGAEYAMESDEWKNGLFTYCLLEGITTKNADADKNGEIMLSELQNYISVKVAELSKGRQMPTSRFENLNLDYRIW